MTPGLGPGAPKPRQGSLEGWGAPGMGTGEAGPTWVRKPVCADSGPGWQWGCDRFAMQKSRLPTDGINCSHLTRLDLFVSIICQRLQWCLLMQKFLGKM